MKSPIQIQKEEATMSTLSKLTSAFEGIASSHLAHIRVDVVNSSAFFEGMWSVYSEIRVDQEFHFGRQLSKDPIIDKELFILITAEGGFSGDIDQRLITDLMEQYKPEKNDIIIVGRHGATQLNQRSMKFVKYYRLPSRDQNINVNPLVKDVQRYKSSKVFYPKYITLTNQQTANINVSALVGELAKDVPVNDDIISDINYIFEPNVYDVVDHIETAMIYVSMSQLLLESKMAQYAARFRAMSAASQVSIESTSHLHTQYRRSIRQLQDERLKEILNSLRKTRVRT